MMEKLQYKIRINAPKKKVWQTMLDSETYKKWVKAFSPHSQFIGEWKQGAHIKFIDPDRGGTKAVLEKVKPYDRLHAKHVAIINQNGSEDAESDVAKNWIGITETYVLKEDDGATELSIDILSHKDFVKMFDDCWPHALELLRGLCEKDDKG
jgi:uncharacterized protein YndB with AHSA1/START domain